MDLGLNGKVALVLGSTSGIGLGIARALSEEGASVAVTGRRSTLATSIAAGLPSAIGLELDVTVEESRRSCVDAVVSAFGAIDIIVLNGGGPPVGLAADLQLGDLSGALDALLVAQIDMVSRVLPAMRESRWGRVLAVGSRGVKEPIPNLARSNIARAALAAYLKTLAGEVAADGITVNLISPGRIDSERVVALDRSQADREGATVVAVRERSQRAIPARRYGTPEEFVCSTRAAYVTGTQVRVDGGSTASM
jgi:3-oxoacyl-[acyl-carrier protein] reductase